MLVWVLLFTMNGLFEEHVSISGLTVLDYGANTPREFLTDNATQLRSNCG